jgi:predicted NBD/HSP70 family sugar kinase
VDRSIIDSRSLVVLLMRAHGTLSRVELAPLTGLTVAAMTNIVRDLLFDGLIEEAGSSGNTGGKPRTMLRLRGEAGYAIGISVDLSTTRFVLVDFAGQVVGRLPVRRSARSIAQLSENIAAGVRSLADDVGIAMEKILGVGIAGQGPHDRSLARYAPTPYADQWLDVGVGQAVEEQLHLPVLLQNDAHAVAAGEYSLSADARASANYAVVYLGESGLGSGIVVDGQLVLGSNSYAGAIAHLSMDVNGPRCFCGSQGCLELYGTPRAIIEAVRRHDADATDSLVGVSMSGPVTPTDMAALYSAARNGHPYAVAQVIKVAQYIAAAAATMAGLLDLDLIIYAGSGFLGMENAYLEAAQEVSDRFERVGARRHFAVRLSNLGSGNDSAAIGAALGVLERPLGTRGRATADRARA